MGSVVALLAVSALSEYRRPRGEPTASSIPVERPVERARIDEFADPERFAELCRRLHVRYLAMDDRYRRLVHTQVSVSRELDDAGDPVATTRTVEDVWFAGGKEFRQPAAEAGADVATDSSQVAARRSRYEASSLSKTSRIYPFSRDVAASDYRYAFAGADTVGDRPVVRVDFEPLEPLAGKFRGVVLVDPDDFEPLRFEGVLVEPPLFVDHFRIVTEYGPAENGAMQIRRLVTDGAGGFAFVRKRYHIETEFRDYRPR